MKIKTIVGALSLWPLAVQAQMVPAIDHTASIPPEMAMANQRINLDKKEREALRIAEEWKKTPNKPRKGEDGSVVYLYGATLPTLICTTMKVCAIRLQSGEVVNHYYLGDTGRWKIYPATIGSGQNAITSVIVKPLDGGMETNVVLTTDRRIYTIRLVSPLNEKTGWMPSISFVYADDMERTWADYKAKQGQAIHAATMPTGESIADLDFRFRISGDNPKWKPQRVYTGGTNTVIQFVDADFKGTEAPALVVLGKDGIFSEPKPKQVNYRRIGDRYVVDYVAEKNERFALITGIDRDQQRVIIEYVGSEQ